MVTASAPNGSSKTAKRSRSMESKASPKKPENCWNSWTATRMTTTAVMATRTWLAPGPETPPETTAWPKKMMAVMAPRGMPMAAITVRSTTSSRWTVKTSSAGSQAALGRASPGSTTTNKVPSSAS